MKREIQILDIFLSDLLFADLLLSEIERREGDSFRVSVITEKDIKDLAEISLYEERVLLTDEKADLKLLRSVSEVYRSICVLPDFFSRAGEAFELESPSELQKRRIQKARDVARGLERGVFFDRGEGNTLREFSLQYIEGQVFFPEETEKIQGREGASEEDEEKEKEKRNETGDRLEGLVCFFGSCGGLGTSTLAYVSAHALSEKGKVLLISINGRGTFLEGREPLEETASLSDVLLYYRILGRFTGEKYLTQHPPCEVKKDLFLLEGLYETEDYLENEDSAAACVKCEVQGSYDYVILDAGNVPYRLHKGLAALAGKVFIVTEEGEAGERQKEAWKRSFSEKVHDTGFFIVRPPRLGGRKEEIRGKGSPKDEKELFLPYEEKIWDGGYKNRFKKPLESGRIYRQLSEAVPRGLP